MKIDFTDKNEWIKLIKFSCVGVVNTLVDLGIYTLLTQVLKLDATFSQAISYSCGIVTSFLGNKFFTFKSKSNALGETWRFILVNLISLGASTSVIYLATDILSWNELIAKIPATAVSMALNYLGSRLFVFKNGNNG